MIKFCKKCLKTRPKDAKFCFSCGEELQVKELVCSCGNELSAADNYCEQCGTKTAPVV
jgi:predicted amidophosphoribosyltransferase